MSEPSEPWRGREYIRHRSLRHLTLSLALQRSNCRLLLRLARCLLLYVDIPHSREFRLFTRSLGVGLTCIPYLCRCSSLPGTIGFERTALWGTDDHPSLVSRQAAMDPFEIPGRLSLEYFMLQIPETNSSRQFIDPNTEDHVEPGGASRRPASEKSYPVTLQAVTPSCIQTHIQARPLEMHELQTPI
ncbi:hypothetical protein LIA77_01729 [Sarocladium implicatum]|nr:hypothetical protein LIA77_01729 [Sarocladium implicatum]